MSSLYLRSVEFSNFRIYGDSYAFEFPDGPSITLITGANGVGKTSFFDGVEWALTNQVSRFQDIPVDGRRKELDPLTRIGAPENSHRVSLQFSDGAPIDRGTGFIPNEVAIAQLLKRPEWAEIVNLHGYLSITHFLGQASTQRFSLRKPDKQWEALKGPAGVDRINSLRERMSGLGVRRAFTRAIEERTGRLQDASSAMANWTLLLGARDRARQLSTSDEAISPSALREVIETLSTQVLQLVPGLNWMILEPSTSVEAVLEDFAALLQAADQRNVLDAETADSLAKIASAFNEASAETVALQSVAGDIEQRRASAVEKLAEVEATLARASTGLAATERRAAQAQIGIVTLTRIRAALRQLDQSIALHAEATMLLERSAVESGRIQARIDALGQELTKASGRRVDRRGLADRVTLARKRAGVSEKLTLTRAEIDRLTPLLAGRQAAALHTRRTDLAVRDTATQALIARMTTDLRAQDDRFQAIAQAVAAIAHHLGHDDTSCPVCASEFAPGRLAALANQQLATDARPITELAIALANSRVESEDLRRQIADVDRASAELEQLLATMTTLHAREHDLRQQLVEAGGSADNIYDESEAIVLEKELEALDAQLMVAETPEQLGARIDEAEAVFRAEMAKRVTLQRTRDTAEADVEAARAALRQHTEFWNEEKGLLVDLDAEQQRIERNFSDLAGQVAAERIVVNDARLTHDEQRETAARETEAQVASNARLDALAAMRTALGRRWEDAGQRGDPDVARVAQYRARIVERAAQIEPRRAIQRQLVAGYRKWQSDEQLHLLESQIAGVIQREKASSEIEVHELLEKRAGEARRELEFTQAARERIDKVGSQMQERAESYADQVLVPLNATIQRFARTLMTWSDASIIYRAEHHVTRSQLRPGIVRSGADGSSMQLEMNPNLYFSEGQLSALSVAALLAASTTFGWSRWRGLLLDDPLQHNDVIHASAFMDLLRQMVRELGYQVVLSTHDSSEAEFLGRKCRSAGIPYYVHELVPQGEAGLISSVA